MPSSRILSILFFLLLVCGFAGGLVLIGLQSIWGMSSDWQSHINESASLGLRNAARIIALLNNVTMFLLPALLCAMVVAKKNWHKLLKINVFSNASNVFYSITIMIISIPLIQYTYGLNQQLPLPSWMKETEAATEIFIKGLLKTEYAYEFWLNMLLFAVIPAFGEEFFFRGVLQQQFKKIFKDPHLAIWATALIFSSIHFQFAGFVPRFLLGGVLGYVFYFTGSLWMPILGHFTNNALMVIAAHLYQNGQLSVDLDQPDYFKWYHGMASLLLTLFILYALERKNEANLNKADEDGLVKY
jgi:uncharacterized protein